MSSKTIVKNDFIALMLNESVEIFLFVSVFISPFTVTSTPSLVLIKWLFPTCFESLLMEIIGLKIVNHFHKCYATYPYKCISNKL